MVTNIDIINSEIDKLADDILYRYGVAKIDGNKIDFTTYGGAHFTYYSKKEVVLDWGDYILDVEKDDPGSAYEPHQVELIKMLQQMENYKTQEGV